MAKNMSNTDRIIRGILGIAAFAIALYVVESALWITVLYVFAAIMLATALTGYCPLYVPFHISTKK